MNNWTIRTRLFALIVLMMAGSLAIGAAGLTGLRGVLDGLNSVYLDRVVPLRDLKLISDLYAVNIVDASHKARDGGIAPTERRAGAGRAAAYPADLEGLPGHQPDRRRKRLIAQIEPLMQKADEPLRRLEPCSPPVTSRPLASFTAKELIPPSTRFSEQFAVDRGSCTSPSASTRPAWLCTSATSTWSPGCSRCC